MFKYRIREFINGNHEHEFRVQYRFVLFPFYMTQTEMVGYETYERVAFETWKEAQQYIDDTLKHRRGNSWKPTKNLITKVIEL